MKKKLLAVVAALGISLLTGCAVEEKITINADLSADVTLECYTTPEEEAEFEKMLDGKTYAEMMADSEMTASGTKMINGKLHNGYTVSEKMSADETKQGFITLTKEKAVVDISTSEDTQTYTASQQTDLSGLDGATITIKYPFAVAKANGQVQEDGCTVVYDLQELTKKKVSRIYAMSASAQAASDKLTIKGVQNNKAYRSKRSVSVESAGVITSFQVNGKEQTADSFTAEQEGKYKLTVTTAAGSKKTAVFYIDATAPTTNIKNNKTYTKAVKITFKDKLSGIKKVTLNGKKIKSGKRVKKDGSYVLKLTDKAGNTKTIKFTMKK